jgi:ribonuclease P protein component
MVLARDDRLHPRSRVRATIRRGARVRSGSLVVHFVADGDRPRAAVVVGKGFGGAVERHRRQRQVRHALASLWDELPAGAIVVRALPAEAGYAQLRKDLDRAVRRL